MTITDISTQMRRLADMAGGDHLTGKEIEKQLNQLARELDANVFMTVDIVDHLRSTTLDACGLTEESLMQNFKFIQLVCKDYEVVTNMPRSCVSYALEQGFEVVDASTWQPVNIENHNNDWIAEMFYNGYIDLVRKVG